MSRHLEARAFVLEIVAVLLLASLLTGTATADGWADDDPARTMAGKLEDHEATSSDPSDHDVGSGEMVEGDSEDPDDMVVDSEEMDVVPSEDLEDHEGSTTAIDDLRMETPDEGFEAIDNGRLDGIRDSDLNARQIVAKRHLLRAQDEATDARTRYGDMIRDNYPRGAARILIVEQRDQTMVALEETRAAFDATMGK